MTTYIGLALAVTVIQLLGAWLRYLPFQKEITQQTGRRLWSFFALWALVSSAGYGVLFSMQGINTFTYKLAMFAGPFPYLIISFAVIKNETMRHIFVVGMQILWVLLLHTVSGTVVTEFNTFFSATQEHVLAHTMLYLFCFVATLPVSTSLFRNLLPPTYLFAEKPAGYYMALLPLGMGVSHMLLLTDDRMVYSWNDHISRLILFFWVFIIYRFILLLARRKEEAHLQEKNLLMTNQRVRSLQDYTRMMWERQEDVMRIRHDLRHYNRVLLSLLENGETKKAEEMIVAQEGELLSTTLPAYCHNPVINAVLAIYLGRAEEQGIPVTHSVLLPPELTVEENDLAMLLANVLENAINASMKQPEDRRAISLSLQYHAPQYVLSVENRFDGVVVTGEDGLPVTAVQGHGFGMASLSAFQKKYRGEVAFSQQDGRVRLLVYWVGKEKQDNVETVEAR